VSPMGTEHLPFGRMYSSKATVREDTGTLHTSANTHTCPFRHDEWEQTDATHPFCFQAGLSLSNRVLAEQTDQGTQGL
jgi:hypothetical protein